jgi:endoglucanase
MSSNPLSRHLAAVLERPTAPFREERLVELVLEFARSRGLPASRDPYGNVAVTYDGHGARREGPPLAFVAALDHPGGEVVAVAGDTAEVAWHGELLSSHLAQARVRVHGRQSFVTAHVSGCSTRVGHLGEVADRLLVQLTDRAQVGDIVTLDLPGVWLTGAEVNARGALALLGAAALLDLLDRLTATRAACVVQAFFTRASGLGFAGTQGLVEAGLLLPGQVALCVHGVPAQPGAQPGAGPVLCLGDALSLFDAEVARVLDHAIARYREHAADAPIQRAALAQGASAAGLLALQGRPVAALAVAVTAAMNMGARGSVEPERFALADYERLVALLEMVCVDWDGPETPARRRAEARQWVVAETGPVLRRLGGV